MELCQVFNIVIITNQEPTAIITTETVVFLSNPKEKYNNQNVQKK